MKAPSSAGGGVVVVENAAAASAGRRTGVSSQRMITSRAVALSAEKKSAEKAPQEGSVGKLLFILAPFILGAVDLVAHDQLVSLFNR